MMKIVAIYHLGRDCDDETTYLLFFSILWLMFLQKNILVDRQAGLIQGLLTDMCECGIVSLQYAEHTFIFLKNDMIQSAMALGLFWKLVGHEN